MAIDSPEKDFGAWATEDIIFWIIQNYGKYKRLENLEAFKNDIKKMEEVLEDKIKKWKESSEFKILQERWDKYGTLEEPKDEEPIIKEICHDCGKEIEGTVYNSASNTEENYYPCCAKCYGMTSTCQECDEEFIPIYEEELLCDKCKKEVYGDKNGTSI